MMGGESQSSDLHMHTVEGAHPHMHMQKIRNFLNEVAYYVQQATIPSNRHKGDSINVLSISVDKVLEGCPNLAHLFLTPGKSRFCVLKCPLYLCQDTNLTRL